MHAINEALLSYEKMKAYGRRSSWSTLSPPRRFLSMTWLAADANPPKSNGNGKAITGRALSPPESPRSPPMESPLPPPEPALIGEALIGEDFLN